MTTTEIASATLTDDLPRTWRLRLRHLPRLFHVVALSAVIVALGDPSYETTRREAPAADVLYVLDVSQSMRALDVAPDRLRRAQEIIATAVRARPGDRVGLVLFAGDHALACPLTEDRAAFLQRLDAVRPGDATGTALGDAAASALAGMQRAGARGLLVVVTDGDSTSGAFNPRDVAARARAVSTPIVAVVTGRGGAVPMPTDLGAIVVETVDRSGDLREMAELSGGRLVDAAAPDAGAAIAAAIAHAAPPLPPREVTARADGTWIAALVAYGSIVGQLVSVRLLRGPR